MCSCFGKGKRYDRRKRVRMATKVGMSSVQCPNLQEDQFLSYLFFDNYSNIPCCIKMLVKIVWED